MLSVIGDIVYHPWAWPREIPDMSSEPAEGPSGHATDLRKEMPDMPRAARTLRGDMSASRTYQVRTYGCQMNMHDSERLAGLLEEAGYQRAPGRGRTRTSWCSTRARSGRTRTTGCTATWATCCRSSSPGRACRSRWAAAWRRRTGPASRGGRPGWTWCSARTTSARCRPCWNAPVSSRPAQVEIVESLERFPSVLPARRESTLLGLGGDLGRLQQHLHVLHRAQPARPGGGPPAGRRAGRDPRRWSPTAWSRSPCSGRT